MQKYAVIVAGGSGSRMKSSLPKQFIEIGNKPILMHTLDAYAKAISDIQLILVLPQTQIEFWQSLCTQHNFDLEHKIVEGGETRFHSVKNGISQIEDEGLVAIHDGVRPFITKSIIEESFKVAAEKGNAVVSVALKDSIRTVKGNFNQVADRNHFQLIQTPQTFQTQLIKKAFDTEYKESFTDDATVLEDLGETINLIQGDYRNIKITTAEDLLIAKALLSEL